MFWQNNYTKQKIKIKTISCKKSQKQMQWLKDEIEKMPEDKKEIEQPDKILNIVEEILDSWIDNNWDKD